MASNFIGRDWRYLGFPTKRAVFVRLDRVLYVTPYLDVIHIAIVYGERDLLELRFGSIRSRDLFDLICLRALQQGQRDESVLLPLDRNRGT